jgi:AraC-like DNA-binding protein
MPKHPPARLITAEYMSPASPFRVFHETFPHPYEIHWHEFYELTFIHAGAGIHVLNGATYPLAPGSCFLLTPVDFHGFTPQPERPLELFNVIFSDEMLSEELHRLVFSRLGEPRADFTGPAFAMIDAEFQRLWAEAQGEQMGRRIMIQGALERILLELARRCAGVAVAPGRGTPTGQHPAVHDALIYLHHHFREPLTLDAVARHAHLTPNYFSGCFHQATGASFQSYLQGLRLRFAMSLLCVSDLPVTDICYASGFYTVSHFVRAFRQKFGRPPHAFRRTVAAASGASAGGLPDHSVS